MTSSADWTRASDWQSIWHRQGEAADGFVKYVNTRTGDEVVFNGSVVVTDPLNRGSFNFGRNPLTHTLLDVIPYLIWGNAPDDPSSTFDRAASVPAKAAAREAEQELNNFLNAVRAAGGTVTIRQ